jgi:versiconal hemiacetal acetate esterase
MIKNGLGRNIQGVVAMVPVTAHPESIPSEWASEYTAYKENASGVPIIDADTMRIFFESVSLLPL